MGEERIDPEYDEQFPGTIRAWEALRDHLRETYRDKNERLTALDFVAGLVAREKTVVRGEALGPKPTS